MNGGWGVEVSKTLFYPVSIPENILLDNFDPSFRSFDPAHLDSGKGIVQLLSNRTHCFHTAWEADFFSVVYDLSYRRDNCGSSAQTAFCELWYFFKEDFSFFYFHSQIFSATYSRERRVIEGRMLLDFGVTSLLSFVIKIKLAPPVSSTFVRVAASRYIFSS